MDGWSSADMSQLLEPPTNTTGCHTRHFCSAHVIIIMLLSAIKTRLLCSAVTGDMKNMTVDM